MHDNINVDGTSGIDNQFGYDIMISALTKEFEFLFYL